MNVKKQLCSLTRMVLPGVGFGLICTGAYLVFLKSNTAWMALAAYIMVVLGLLALLVGVFWTICLRIKSKMYQREGHERHIQIFTTERPSSFPPSYEQSQCSHVSPEAAAEFVVVEEGVDVALSLAPPLYNPDSSAAPDCTWSWERPPRYSEVEPEQHQHRDAGH